MKNKNSLSLSETNPTLTQDAPSSFSISSGTPTYQEPDTISLSKSAVHREVQKKSNEQGLIVFSSPPYGKITAQEGQDLTMAASAFYPSLSVLFLGDGLLNCLKSQMVVDTLKPFCKTFAAFPVYDIQNLYASQQDCEQFGLSANDFNLPLIVLDHIGLQSLIQHAHWILHY